MSTLKITVDPDDANVQYTKEMRRHTFYTSCMKCGKTLVPQMLRAVFKRHRKCPSCDGTDLTQPDSQGIIDCRRCGQSFNSKIWHDEWGTWIVIGWECLHHTVMVKCECCDKEFEALDSILKSDYPIYCLICHNERLGGEEAE